MRRIKSKACETTSCNSWRDWSLFIFVSFNECWLTDVMSSRNGPRKSRTCWSSGMSSLTSLNGASANLCRAKVSTWLAGICRSASAVTRLFGVAGSSWKPQGLANVWTNGNRSNGSAVADFDRNCWILGMLITSVTNTPGQLKFPWN